MYNEGPTHLAYIYHLAIDNVAMIIIIIIE